MKNGFGFLMITMIFACGQPSATDRESEQNKNPVYTIIYLNDYYSRYLDLVHTDYSSKDKFYNDEILGKMLIDHFLNSEYFNFVQANFSYLIPDTGGIRKSISDINKHRNQMEKAISFAITECTRHLKIDSLIIYVYPTNAEQKDIYNKMGGVIGSAAGSKQMLLAIDFDNKTWEKSLEYAIAHEFNHVYWTKNNYSNQYHWTVLRYLVFEGKADYFAHLLFPKVEAPWTHALTENQKALLWDKLQPQLDREDQFHLGEIMFGSDNYPEWGGYTIGFEILSSAFKNHPELINSNWTNLNADTTLGLSDYR